MNEIAPAANKPPIVVLRERLEHRKSELALALPTDIPADQFIRAVMTSAAINPDILACTWQSIWIACMKACRDGLVPDGQDAAIVAFKNTAQYIAMYPGLLRRFRRSGQFKWVAANPVRQGEDFSHWIDESGEHFRHVPGTNDNAPIEKVYAIAGTKDGATFVAVLSMAEIEKIRAQSRASRDDSPWKQWPVEMMRKSAIRRLSKVLPSARDILHNEDDDSDNQPVEVVAAAATQLRATGAAAALEQFAGAPSPAVVSPDNAGDAEGGEQPAPATDAVSAAPDGTGAAATDPQAVAITAAFRDGQDALRAGDKRTAVPARYRSPDRKKELEAWYAGYDGKSQLL